MLGVLGNHPEHQPAQIDVLEPIQRPRGVVEIVGRSDLAGYRTLGAPGVQVGREVGIAGRVEIEVGLVCGEEKGRARRGARSSAETTNAPRWQGVGPGRGVTMRMAAWIERGSAPGSARGTSIPPSPGSNPGTRRTPHARRRFAECAGGRRRPIWVRSRRRSSLTPAAACRLWGDRSPGALCHPHPLRGTSSAICVIQRRPSRASRNGIVHRVVVPLRVAQSEHIQHDLRATELPATRSITAGSGRTHGYRTARRVERILALP